MAQAQVGFGGAGEPSPPFTLPAPHADVVEDLFTRLESAWSGLSNDEADRRLRRWGPNRLEAARPVSRLKILGDHHSQHENSADHAAGDVAASGASGTVIAARI
jgi:hypothetical protein